MPEGGRVTITAERKNGSVEVTVSDNGPGINAEIRSQLFQPFATHGKKTGLGLGLALSRQTVIDHGGDLWAQESNGKGATFGLRFPVG
jgi:signal transduction histidine kinase